MREVWGSRPGPVKSDKVSQGTRHRAVFFELWSWVAWAISGGNGSRYLLHALAEYREYNDGLIFWILFCDETLLYQNEKIRNA